MKNKLKNIGNKKDDQNIGFKKQEAQKSRKILEQTFISNYRTTIIVVMAMTIAMVIDGVIVGQFLGTTCMAAYGLAVPIFMVLNAIFAVFSTGIQSLIANHMARGDTKRVNAIFNSSLIICFGLSVILVLVLVIFLDPICNLLCISNTGDNKDEIIALVKQYLIGMAIAIPLEFCSRVLSALMQLDSDVKRVYLATFIGSSINICGDLLNVTVVGWGMFGIALATTFGYVAELIVYVTHFFKKDRVLNFNPKLAKWDDTWQTIWVGFPRSIEYLCNTLRAYFLNSFLLILCGSIGVAAFAIQSNSLIFFTCVLTGLGGASTLLANVFMGEKDTASLRRLFKLCFKADVIVVGGVAVLIFIFAPIIVSLYSSDSSVNELAIASIRFFAISMPFSGILLVIQGYTQANKKIILTSTLSILSNCVLVIAFAYIFGSLFGINGIWISFLLAAVATIIIYIIIIMIKNKKVSLKFEDLLFLPQEEEGTRKSFEFTIQNEEDVMLTTLGSEALCMQKGIDERRTNALTLCLEEMGVNIVEHGIAGNKKHFVDVKITIDGDDIIIRMRDNCPAFNPVEYHKVRDPDDLMAGLGIKMVFKMAKDVNYVSTFKLNNLIITM